MTTASKAWEGVRENGLILITVHQCNWTRTAYEWEIWRLRAYLRTAVLPVQTRLEIASWLEKQEADVECEMGARREPRPLMAEQIAWASLGVAVMSVVIFAAVMVLMS